MAYQLTNLDVSRDVRDCPVKQSVTNIWVNLFPWWFPPRKPSCGTIGHPRAPGAAAADYVSTGSCLPLHIPFKNSS